MTLHIFCTHYKPIVSFKTYCFKSADTLHFGHMVGFKSFRDNKCLPLSISIDYLLLPVCYNYNGIHNFGLIQGEATEKVSLAIDNSGSIGLLITACKYKYFNSTVHPAYVPPHVQTLYPFLQYVVTPPNTSPVHFGYYPPRSHQSPELVLLQLHIC